MSAVLLVLGALVLGFVAGFVVSARDEVRNGPQRHQDDLARQWREGQAYGQRQGVEEGYMAGWTSGRSALLGEQEAQRRHPTGSPLSHLRALDAEADRRMKGEA